MKVAVHVDDLMFGSRVGELLEAAGHEVFFGKQDGADAAFVDLTHQWVDKPSVPTLAVFGHTSPETRDRALAAGYEVVVPRSRFMREAAALMRQLVPDAQ